MAELSGSPFRGAARADVFITLTPENRHSAWVECTVGSPQPTGDQAIWEGTGSPFGDTLTLRFKWTTQGTGSDQQAPNFATVEARLPGGAIIGSAWTVAFPAANTEVTRTFHFDSDPLNQTLDLANLRCGMIELYVNWGSTGGVTPWAVDSRGTATGLLPTNTAEWARGYLRNPVDITNHTISNVSLGGANPALYASPDPLFFQIFFGSAKYRSQTLELEVLRTGTSTVEREQTLAAQTTNGHSYSWTGTTGTNRRVGNGMFLGQEAKDLRLKLAALDFGGDNEYVFKSSISGWTRDSDLQLTNPSELTVDPRLTVRNDGNINGTAPGALFHQQGEGDEFFDPPSSGDIDTGQRVFPDVSFLSVRYANTRGEGVVLGVTLKIWDADEVTGNESSPTHTFSGTTATRRDPPPAVTTPEAGWLPKAASGADENVLPLVWSSVAAGTWRVKSVVTSPSDLTGLEEYPLSSGGVFWNRNVFFIVSNANYAAYIAIHPELLQSHGTHLTFEDNLIPVVQLLDLSNDTLVELEEANGDNVAIIVTRTHHPTMRMDYFDHVLEEWILKPIGGSMAAGRLQLVRGSVHSVGGDPDVWTTATHIGGTIFAPDSGGDLDIQIIADITKDGVHYSSSIEVSFVGPYNKHNQPYNTVDLVVNLAGSLGAVTELGEPIDVRISIADLADALITMTPASAFFAARRFNTTLGEFEVWDGAAWLQQDTLIYLTATIGADPSEPMTAVGTLPGTAVDRQDEITIFAKATRTEPVTSFLQNFYGTAKIGVVVYQFDGVDFATGFPRM